MWPFRKRQSLADSGIFQGFTDWHCHILPGVDDGVQTMDEALEILTLYEKLGVKSVWITPHIMEDVPNTTAHLKERFEELQAAYKGAVHLHLAAEYMLDNLFCERLNNSDLLPLGEKENWLLVETSCYNPPMDFAKLLERIKKQGYHPILAHLERYTYMEIEDYHNLKKKNVQLQLNIFSLSGMYGSAVCRKAQMMLQTGMYDLVGTDTHRYKDFCRMASTGTIKRSVSEKLSNLSSSTKSIFKQ